MAGPLVATKLSVPGPRRGAVVRPRLRELLGRGAESRLTLVSAPAGFGKTTALADAVQGRRSVAWLSLDEGDSRPASFWISVRTALQTVVPGVGGSA